MSDLQNKLTEKKEVLKEKVGGKIAKVKRSLATRMGRAFAWKVGNLDVMIRSRTGLRAV